MRIVIISNNDWDGLWYQRQQFAAMYAQKGNDVLFVNKTLQRLPKIKDFADRFFKKKTNNRIVKNAVPHNITVINIYTLPPFKAINWLNKIIIKLKFRNFEYKNCDLLITYVPSFTSLDIIEYLHPRKSAYINVHNYDADNVIKDLLKSERIMVNKVNYLFGDSVYNMNRLKRINKHREIHSSLPGVDTARFKVSFRTDEHKRAKSIYYFGGIGDHLDFEIYNSLSKDYEVVFIGKFNEDSFKSKVSERIKIIPPVANDELPKYLLEADIIGIFYQSTQYVRGVIPAKIYECMATKKPILTKGIYEMTSFQPAVYICENEAGIRLILQNISDSETQEIVELREALAENANWATRFKDLNKRMELDV